MPRMKEVRLAKRALAAASGERKQKKEKYKGQGKEANNKRVHGTSRNNPDEQLVKRVLKRSNGNPDTFKSLCKKATSDPHSSITRENIEVFLAGGDIKNYHIPPLKQAMEALGLIEEDKLIRILKKNDDKFESIYTEMKKYKGSKLTTKTLQEYAEGKAIKDSHIPLLKMIVEKLGLTEQRNNPEKGKEHRGKPKQAKHNSPKCKNDATTNDARISAYFLECVRKDCFDQEGNLINMDIVQELSEATGVHINNLKDLFIQGVGSLNQTEEKTGNDPLERQAPKISVRLRPGQEAKIVSAYAQLAPDSGIA